MGQKAVQIDGFPGWTAVAATLGRYGVTKAHQMASLRRQITAVQQLGDAVGRLRSAPRLRRRPKSAKMAQSTSSWHAPAPTGRRRAPVTGPCSLCKAERPHRTPEARRHHMRSMRSVQGWKRKVQLYGPTGFTDEQRARGRATVLRRHLDRRVALFEATVPHAAAVLGPAAVRQIVASYRRDDSHTWLRHCILRDYGGADGGRGQSLVDRKKRPT